MGSGGKGGGSPSPDYNMMAGENGYNQWSPGGEPAMQPGQDFYDPYMQGWNMHQSEYDTQQQMMDMFKMAIRPPVMPEQKSAAEYAYEMWDTGGGNSAQAIFRDVQLFAANTGTHWKDESTWAEQGEGEFYVHDLPGYEDVRPYDGGDDYDGPIVNEKYEVEGLEGWHGGVTREQIIKAGGFDELIGYDVGGNSIQSGVADRNDLIKTYTTALENATSQVNATIENEISNAAIMGINYDITDENKAVRISNALSNYWSESAQTDLDNIIEKWGAGGFEQSVFMGAEPEEVTPVDVDAPTPGTSVTPKTPTTMLTEEEMLGATSNSLLGG